MGTSYKALRKIKLGKLNGNEDDDPLETIKTRMEEINMMVKPRAELGNFLNTIDPAQRNRIMKYKHVDANDIKTKKRKNWKARDRFIDAVHKVILMYWPCEQRKRYLHNGKPDTSPEGIKQIRQNNRQSDPKELLKKSSLGYEMRLALVTQAGYRSADDIKKATQILRATKAFKHLFPEQLEQQLARKVAYERYDGDRIVAQQGRDPERFYFILTGKLLKVREYRLLSGVVTREEGAIEKGCTTDPQEMAQNWPREHHLVTKGNTELLVLDKNDFLDLLHTCKGPPIDFLRGIELFDEFPCEMFLDNQDAIDFKYYGKENIIVKDSNRTPWLYVVKTGRVKVVRMQTIIDVQNEDSFSAQSTEGLGCARPFSHASAMLGTLAKQRKMKALLGTVSFPELLRLHRPSVVNFSASKESSVQSTPRVVAPKEPTQKTEAEIMVDFRNTSSGKLAKIKEDSEHSDIISQTQQSVRPLSNKTPKLVITSPKLTTSSSKQRKLSDTEHRPSFSFLPPISGSRRESEIIPHGTYLTREQTDFDPVYKGKSKKDAALRETYLQLDVLKAGDIFGLEHLEPQALASEAPGVTLISDGAEIIKISKRFFIQHAKNNTMLKVETMQREYMSAEEAKEVMYNKETWQKYKTVLLSRTISNLSRSQIDKVH
ncbi:uncharacterized protein LOC127878895 isoform X2 [Dreissena polymorpha]|uniref:Cyclic nucleotide-binding domain-containing protein n=1 Tax=Dreissena polymorpha TaxID=45954 RepID=A0A9D4K8Z3_DREPO|nr:uncharacterized protein LOC127878895 isoform X2 [Dreissena polymorpha]XP_052281388.1 uncharacterized protein LOC127878895 isoform X2 [Dreissena polymorpha]KAH3835165.1 hypothetical protein DPMN_108512 [Dreissena polymorpha]